MGIRVRVIAVWTICLVILLSNQTARYVVADGWFDYYGRIEWRDEQLRLVNFEMYLQKYPETVGYIGFNWSCPEEFDDMKQRAARAKDFLVSRRKIDKDRIIVVQGGPHPGPRTVLHISSKDSPWPDFS